MQECGSRQQKSFTKKNLEAVHILKKLWPKELNHLALKIVFSVKKSSKGYFCCVKILKDKMIRSISINQFLHILHFNLGYFLKILHHNNQISICLNIKPLLYKKLFEIQISLIAKTFKKIFLRKIFRIPFHDIYSICTEGFSCNHHCKNHNQNFNIPQHFLKYFLINETTKIKKKFIIKYTKK